MLMDLSSFGLPREPTVREAVEAGIDVVTFSGDKLLGGPQAGLIVGTRAAIDKLRRHPLARAMRIDKLTLAALEATLALYLNREQAIREIPVLRMLSMPTGELEQRSRAFTDRLSETLRERAEVTVVSEPSTVGGGALPLTELPGYAVALAPKEMSVDALAGTLRASRPPVIGRCQDNRLLLNLRTVLPDEEASLIHTLKTVLTP
jgi:L-seryl-tRNA(Ser) seleniumtransferase